MAGHASTAGIWPAMSTNVVHMAQSSRVEMGCAVRRGEIASPLPQCRCCLQTHTTLFNQQINTILGRLIRNCAVWQLYSIIGMETLTFSYILCLPLCLIDHVYLVLTMEKDAASK